MAGSTTIDANAARPTRAPGSTALGTASTYAGGSTTIGFEA